MKSPGKYAFVVVLLLTTIHAFAAVDPPSLRCLAAGTNSVVLTWEIPPDPSSEFVSYHIFSSGIKSGGYTEIGVVGGYGQTTFTHTPVNPVAGDLFYYVKTKYNDGSGDQVSFSSDTLQVIRLNITNASDETGHAELSWNSIHQPELNTSSGTYNIYKKNTAAAPWTLINTVPFGTNFYKDNEKVCDDSLYYKVEIGDNSGCTSVSTIAGERIRDGVFPAIPEIDSVSVDAAGNIMIGWQPSDSLDAGGYLVYYNNNGNWFIDTVMGYNNTYFLDQDVDGTSDFQVYGVAAMDTCGITSPIDVKHKSVFLEATLNQCEKSVGLSWNDYEGWPVSKYKVYGKVDNQPWQLLDEVTGNSYTHEDLQTNSNYCYRVRAIASGNSRTSSSNELCLTVYSSNLPGIHYLNAVSVLENGSIEISWYSEKVDNITFVIKRAGSENGEYIKIGQLANPSDTLLSFIDNSGDPHNYSYYYKVSVINQCGVELLASNIAKSVHVAVDSDNDNLVNHLRWNAYKGWDALGNGVEQYIVYRSTSGTRENAEAIAVLPPDQLTFSDNISGKYDEGGEFCYFINATEASGNSLDFKEVSYSNTSCTELQPKLFIPSAFSPNEDGINDQFKPGFSFIDKQDYYFAVYSKWGEKVFETTDPDQAWDGRSNGRYVTQDVYVYLVKINSTSGNTIERRGSVVVMR